MEEEFKDYLAEIAKKFWAICPYDFCVQYDNFPISIVYGGTNRVVWSPKHGFWVDKPYCSDRFIEHFEKVMNGGE